MCVFHGHICGFFNKIVSYVQIYSYIDWCSQKRMVTFLCPFGLDLCADRAWISQKDIGKQVNVSDLDFL